jgi:hypothetical protein
LIVGGHGGLSLLGCGALMLGCGGIAQPSAVDAAAPPVTESRAGTDDLVGAGGAEAGGESSTGSSGGAALAGNADPGATGGAGNADPAASGGAGGAGGAIDAGPAAPPGAAQCASIGQPFNGKGCDDYCATWEKFCQPIPVWSTVYPNEDLCMADCAKFSMGALCCRGYHVINASRTQDQDRSLHCGHASGLGPCAAL